MPAFPQPFTSTVSHWQETNRGPTSLWSHGREASLPTEVVDYVIIGAGATGAALGYQLSRAGAGGVGKSIVLLDAKDAASCASGRNGGHVAPRAWAIFPILMAPLEKGGGGLNAEQVLDIIFFEQDTWIWSSALSKTRDSRSTFGVDTDASPKYKHRKLDWTVIMDPAEAKRVSRINDAVACNLVPSGSWHPHRGVTALLRLALESKAANVQFFSWAPASGITNLANGLVSVDCGPRGIVTARQVIVATNAYTRHLLPETQDLLVPRLAQACRVVPTASYSGPESLSTTYTVREGPYLIQTPNSGLIFGPYPIIDETEHVFNVEDDSIITPGVGAWLDSWCRDHFVNWGKESAGEGLVHHWSGVICHSADLRPFVGAVPGRPGVFISAGYSGHGMAQLVNITRGLVNQLRTGQWDDAIPRSFALTEHRMERARAEAVHPLDYEKRGVTLKYFDGTVSEEVANL
ncbi:uncharacterized protein LOC62_02G001803 [Vanrija pseudolonga]|uniref:FAD dependent oxidoreductase domain-containing protein n=1 Tax=Vanrija pseudolonga TaxID=143232 RepID=A0AAF1BNL5_9TREE|nr:hypothetical protein LOC62_02G001803 [Vanrija pseudolonga]